MTKFGCVFVLGFLANALCQELETSIVVEEDIPKTEPEAKPMNVKGEIKGTAGLFKPLPILAPAKWIEAEDPLLMKDRNVKAFRNLIVERAIQRAFQSSMAKISLSKSHFILQDPIHMKEGISLTKSDRYFNVDFSADNIRVKGVKNLQLSYIRVVQHFGLMDMKVSLRIGGNIEIVGDYRLNGKALSILPIRGDGEFKINIQGCSISGIGHLLSEKDELAGEDRLVMHDLMATVDYDTVHFDFANLLGGGVVGSVANSIINSVGEGIIDTQRKLFIDMVKDFYRKEISKFI